MTKPKIDTTDCDKLPPEMFEGLAGAHIAELRQTIHSLRGDLSTAQVELEDARANARDVESALLHQVAEIKAANAALINGVCGDTKAEK